MNNIYKLKDVILIAMLFIVATIPSEDFSIYCLCSEKCNSFDACNYSFFSCP